MDNARHMVQYSASMVCTGICARITVPCGQMHLVMGIRTDNRGEERSSPSSRGLRVGRTPLPKHVQDHVPDPLCRHVSHLLGRALALERDDVAYDLLGETRLGSDAAYDLLRDDARGRLVLRRALPNLRGRGGVGVRGPRTREPTLVVVLPSVLLTYVPLDSNPSPR
jgi:hypothetical protein